MVRENVQLYRRTNDFLRFRVNVLNYRAIIIPRSALATLQEKIPGFSSYEARDPQLYGISTTYLSELLSCPSFFQHLTSRTLPYPVTQQPWRQIQRSFSEHRSEDSE